MLCCLHPWPSLFSRCYDPALCHCVPAPQPPPPPPPPHRWNRPCERSEGVRRLRHSLGCFSTLVPWAEKAPTPLQPLGLRSPDPASWYSGLCPCLPGTVFFSSLSQSVRLTLTLGLPPPLLTSTAVRCAVFSVPHLSFLSHSFCAKQHATLQSCTFARRRLRGIVCLMGHICWSVAVPAVWHSFLLTILITKKNGA